MVLIVPFVRSAMFWCGQGSVAALIGTRQAGGLMQFSFISALTTVEDFGQKVVKGGTKGVHEWEHPTASMDSHNIYLQNVGMRSTTQCTL
jgi:hypothetical protein